MRQRWKLIELIEQVALRVQDANLLEETATAILDAIEPEIRADEKEQRVTFARDAIIIDRSILRKRVEALPTTRIEPIGQAASPLTVLYVRRADVLALFDGSDS